MKANQSEYSRQGLEPFILSLKQFFYGSNGSEVNGVISSKTSVSEYIGRVTAWLLDSLAKSTPTDLTPDSALPPVFVDSVSATVAFAGTYSGSVSIHCPSALAGLLAARMTGFESVEENETVNDALGELANVLAGEIKLALSAGGLDIQLSMPGIVSGSCYSLSTPRHDNTATIAWQVDGLPFQVSLVADRNRLLQDASTELRSKREWLSLALEGGTLGLWDWEPSSGKAHYSDEWATMLGYDPQALFPEIGTWESLVHPDDLPLVQAMLQEHLAGRADYFEVEFRMLSSCGKWRWIMSRGRVVERHVDGTPGLMAGIHLDVSDRKYTEDILIQQALRLEAEMYEREQAQVALHKQAQELADLNRTLEERVAEEVHKNQEKSAQLMHQEKLASIGQLAAGVAHEINNPMGFIMSNLNALKEYTSSLQQYCRVVDELLPDSSRLALQEARTQFDLDYILDDLQPLLAESMEGAERVRRIVLALKDFARSDLQELQEADLNLLVQSTINIVRNELKYVAQLELCLGELPIIVCHPQQLNQVISNLLLNAAHAIEKQGVITVTTRLENGWVILTVADTGKGIPPDIRSRIFDPFFTTKSVGKGTGLGLSISYDIVQKHSGEIAVESEPGVGTTFTVKLPIASPFANQSR